jgi:type IV secretory pathway VirB10-like protein
VDAFDTSLQRRPRAFGLKLGVIFIVLLVIVGAWVAAYYWAKSTGQLARIERTVGTYDVWPSWMGKGVKKASYTDQTPAPNHVLGPDPRDAKLLELQRRLDELERERLARQQPAPPPKAPTAKVVPHLSRVSYERKTPPEETTWVGPDLFAGTFIPAVLETRLHSDREGCSVARVREHVRDSRTAQAILIPQNSLLVLCYKSKDLIWGDERIEVGLERLTLPNGRVVELPKEPAVDHIGQAGWTGAVNHHYWRLLSAVLIRGVLRGGAQVVQTQIGGVAGGVMQEGAQATQTQTQPFINIRPTIIVPEGEPVNILLTKGLQLPVYQEAVHALR